VVFAASEFGVSPGQACVFYDADENEARVLGGGFIAAIEPATITMTSHAPPLRAAEARRSPR
jgi:tRNA-specific 2-thiouridylase